MRSPLRTRTREARRAAFTGIAVFCLGCAFACGPRTACPQPAPGETSAASCGSPCPAWSTKKGARCACRSDATPWLGACVATSLAARACGAAETLVDGACVLRGCGDDQVWDDQVAGCVAWSSIRPSDATGATGATGGLPPAPDERVQCPTDSVLRVSRGRARCLPTYACARGLVPMDEPVVDGGVAHVRDTGGDAGADAGASVGGLCAPAPSCPPGSLPEPRGAHRCTSFMTTNGFVDPARWLRLTAGEEGGAGSRWVCEPLDVLGVKVFDPHGTARRISLQLDIPSNDVSDASLTARSDDAAEGTRPLEKGLETYAEAFRSLGGTATTTQAAVHVVCRVPASPRPVKLHVDGVSPPPHLGAP